MYFIQLLTKKNIFLIQFNTLFRPEIYSAKRGSKTVFVVLFNNENFMWQKYEGTTFGSGQNYVYYKEHKINTSIFIDLSHGELIELFNGINPEIFIQRRIEKQNQQNQQYQ